MPQKLSGLQGTKFTVRDLRGREVYERLHGKVDPEVVSVIAALAEHQHAMDIGMGEIAVMLDQMANINLNMVEVAAQMKGVIEAHRRPKDDMGIDSNEH